MRLVILRAGWMRDYAGEDAQGHGPIGGGSYNKHKLGHERFNFKDVGGRLYGYVEAQSKRTGGLNLERIDPETEGDQLDDVLVIFVATRPGGGQRIVGWYTHATAHRVFQKPFGSARADCGYQVECEVTDAVLLPLAQRTWEVPTGAGGMKQARVRYAYGREGKLRLPPWWAAILKKIAQYKGPNQLTVLNAAVQDAAADHLEAQLGEQGIGGFQPDSKVRCAIELHAMSRAVAYFESDGWFVEDTHVGNPFDLRISRDGESFRVEVKGTTGEGREVVLTRGEVESAERSPSALFILRRVKVSSDGEAVTASGGEVVLHMPWKLHQGSLTAVSYFYRPPSI